MSIWVLSVVAALAVSLGISQGRAGISADPTASGADRRPLLSASTSVRHRPSALFLGDSFTVGPAYLSDYGYACLLATNMGWDCNLAAEGSTGYIAGGQGYRLAYVAGLRERESTSVAERIPRIRELDTADIVVLDAGRNDISYGRETFGNVFVYTVRRAREAWPNARIVVIAPWFVTQPTLEFPGYPDETVGDYLERRLSGEPGLESVTVIDPARLNWFSGVDPRLYLTADGVHPNEMGHKQISQYLTTQFIRLGFAGPT